MHRLSHFCEFSGDILRQAGITFAHVNKVFYEGGEFVSGRDAVKADTVIFLTDKGNSGGFVYGVFPGEVAIFDKIVYFELQFTGKAVNSSRSSLAMVQK